MPKTPTIPEIIADFEREIARAPRWAQVDRALLQRLIDDHRRLEEQLRTLGANYRNVVFPTHSQRESQGRVVGA